MHIAHAWRLHGGLRSLCGFAIDGTQVQSWPAGSAVGPWYIDFSQTTDEEVRYLLPTHYADGSRKRIA